MTDKLKAWLRFFRVVNLPTVPGDVFAGVAVACAFCPRVFDCSFQRSIFATLASMLLYMYGLSDNDIVGAKTDIGRPIPQGLIALPMARMARTLCLFGIVCVGLAAKLPDSWWYAACALIVTILIYNRTKSAVLMGLCRGLDVVCGGTAVAALWSKEAMCALAIAALVWTIYIWAVTKYSEGEETNPARKRRVGKLIGALVWIQLAVVAIFACFFHVFWLLAAQIIMIAALFVLKRLLPEVSAS